MITSVFYLSKKNNLIRLVNRLNEFCIISSHRNVAIRNTTAQLMCYVVEIMGPDRVLREFSEKVLPVAAQFVMDSSQEARFVALHLYNEQCIMYFG
jgi:hypothetical protein